MAEHVSELLRRSVSQLETDVPDSYRHTLDALGPLVVALAVDGERFSLSGGDRLVVTDGDTPDAAVSITTTRATMLDVLDGHVALTGAVEGGAVAVRGSLEHVLRAHDTLRAYVHAATRAPSHHRLLDALRAS